jgi:hypothetical protein
METRMVLLYGSSMLLSLVADSLTQCSELHVAQAGSWAQACRQLAEEPPDALIFDLTNGCESHILPLLLKNPSLLMIGLDTESNQAVLVSGQKAQSLTLHQIREIVGERRGEAEKR